MFRHRNWLLLASAVLFAVVLASVLFGGAGDRTKPSAGERPPEDEPPPAAGSAEKPLRMTVAMQPKEFQLLQQLKDQYESAHPGVVVRLENVPERTAYAKLKKAAQVGDAPDVMLLDNDWVSEFAALGYLAPVDSMLTADLQARQMEQALAQVKWNGYLWGVPKDVDVYVIVYNAKKLNEWGGEKPPASTEDALALHRQNHKPEEGQYGIAFDPQKGRSFAALVRMVAGSKTASKTMPVKLNDASVLKALETFLYANPDGVKDEPRPLGKSFPPESASWKPWELLAQGRLTGYVTTLSDWKQNGSPAVTMAALPLPKGEEPWKGAWLSGRSFAISARSEAGKESYELIRELVSAGSAMKFWSAAGNLPAQAGVYASGISADDAVKRAAAFIDQDDASPAFPQRAKMTASLEAQLETLWRGDVALKAFAERTEAEWEAIRPTAKGN
ncbi:sugar ABC transporter substrate-binding protein [Paenibacillus flagellatus]|uniref:ABC transporter substrate-binding protein n=1 Tax=Paenibacillus flagellatus TaxID=2211139 RepID=A0A2V5K6Z1_9BACL|nr:extracellular solute-binding protein [Paenibacillus flagellatus]PYI54602.1 hypothetical protein DLM86_14190 [Paenibacillus flagellatus]